MSLMPNNRLTGLFPAFCEVGCDRQFAQRDSYGSKAVQTPRSPKPGKSLFGFLRSFDTGGETLLNL